MKSVTFTCCTMCFAFLLGTASLVAPQSTQSSSPQWSEYYSQTQYKNSLAGWWRGRLEGYTDKSSAKQGETIAFKVSVWQDNLQAGTYTVEIYRVGASISSDQFITTLGSFTSAFQPLYTADSTIIYPGLSPDEYMAQGLYPMEYRKGCTWPTAFTVTIPSNWPSGYYYAKLTLGSYSGKIPFVVKEDSPRSTSKILCVIAWNTYQAYNYWGGGSLYWWTGDFAHVEFQQNGAPIIRTVSLQRPFGLHHHWDDSNCGEEHRLKFVDQIGQFHHRERQFINWAESNGYTMEYCIDFDVHDPNQGQGLLNNYKLVVFPGHSEYWSQDQRLNVEGFRNGGGNLAFFAANNCYWMVNFQASNTQIFCDKENDNFWWRKQEPEGPESQLIGILFGGLNSLEGNPGYNGPNVVTNAGHWLFSGSGLSNGASFGRGNPNNCSDVNIDPLVIGEVDMRAKSQYMPPNATVELLAQSFIRNLTSADGGHYNDPSLPSNQLYSEVTYYENTATNARVFASGSHGWCNSLYGTDGNTMGIITQNILDHFSFKKYRGNIYTNLEWGNDPQEISTVLDGDTYILPGKTLSLVNGFTLTINPGVTLYVQGTLSLASNVTITGGGTVVIQGSGKILASNSAEATAFNNSRKIVKDANGDYHVVFETEGEICYEKLNGGTALSKFQRLSSGNGNNRFPDIAERSGRLYVVWQRQNGSFFEVRFRKSLDLGATWQPLPSPLATITTSNSPLPVITSPATDKLTVVYRTPVNLSSQISTNDGNTWSNSTVQLGGNHQSPTLAPTTTYWGSTRSALAYSNSSGTVYYRYYRNGPIPPAGATQEIFPSSFPAAITVIKSLP